MRALPLARAQGGGVPDWGDGVRQWVGVVRARGDGVRARGVSDTNSTSSSSSSHPFAPRSLAFRRFFDPNFSSSSLCCFAHMYCSSSVADTENSTVPRMTTSLADIPLVVPLAFSNSPWACSNALVRTLKQLPALTASLRSTCLSGCTSIDNL